MKRDGVLAIVAHGCIIEHESYTVPKDINLIFVSPPGCYSHTIQFTELLGKKERIKRLLDPSIPDVQGYLVDRVRGGTTISNMLFDFRHNLGLMGVYAVPIHPHVLFLRKLGPEGYDNHNKIKLQSLMHKYDLLDINSLYDFSNHVRISIKALLEHLGPGTYIIATCRAPCTAAGRFISSVSRKIPFLKTPFAKNENRFRATLPTPLREKWDATPYMLRSSTRAAVGPGAVTFFDMLESAKQHGHIVTLNQINEWEKVAQKERANEQNKKNKKKYYNAPAWMYGPSHTPTLTFLAHQVAPSIPERVSRVLRRNSNPTMSKKP